MDWAQVLVIILSVFLALFLLLGIVLVIMLIRVTRQIKAVTDSARTTAEHIEHAVTGITRATSPAVILRFITKHFRKVKKHRGGEDV
ncbi:MAG TPA: hypothetical protein VFT59_06205 [Candidatus Saccharimonadales bacterium]|nr:hypothetical protein [Candidatus Saccharimonadales bacterium]